MAFDTTSARPHVAQPYVAQPLPAHGMAVMPRRWMMRALAVAAIALDAAATGCSQLNASHPSDLRPISLPVAATSIPSVYGIQLTLRGSASVHDGWVYLDIPTGVARTYQGRASAWDLVVRAGIATCNGRGWGHVISEGQAGRIAPLVGLTEDAPELDTVPRTFTAPLHLDVGIPPGTDLAHSWVTLDVSWPVEATIARYTLTASGGIAAPASDPPSTPSVRSSGKEADPLQELETLHAAPRNVSCT